MVIRRIAGFNFLIVGAGVFAFQVALAFGVPWGAYAMGGACPGQFPPAMRVASVIEALLWVVFVGIVLARAHIAFRRLARASRWMTWVVVTASAVSIALNLLTPSGSERMIWAPVGFVLLASSLIVATRQPANS